MELPEGVEVTNAPAIPVATVEVPRALRGKDTEAEDEDDDATEA